MERRLSRGRWAAVAFITAALVVTVAITSALGGGGFLTKKKANKRYAKKGAVYTKGQSDARFLPLSHTSRYMVSPANWVTTAGSSSVILGSGETSLAASIATTDRFFFAALTLPQTVAGRTVQIDSFELCYQASAPQATLDGVFLFKIADATAADWDGAGSTPISDDTDREDDTCRTYAGAAPVPLGPNDLAQVAVRVDYSGPGVLPVGRLSVNLSS